MDQELRLEQKTQQLSTILNIVSKYLPQTQLMPILEKVDTTFPEMDFFNSNAYKQSTPGLMMAASENVAKKKNKKAKSKMIEEIVLDPSVEKNKENWLTWIY